MSDLSDPYYATNSLWAYQIDSCTATPMTNSNIARPGSSLDQSVTQTTKALFGVQEYLSAGHRFVKKYWASGDRDGLADAAMNYRSALARAPDDTDDKLRAKLLLADTLRLRYEEGKAGDEHFFEALALAEDAHRDTKAPSTLHLGALRVLGDVLMRRNHEFRSEFLQRAGATFGELVNLTAQLPCEVQVEALALFADAANKQYDSTRQATFDDLANALVDRALEALPHNTSTPLRLGLALAFARSNRYQATHNMDDLVQSIDVSQSLMSAFSPSHPLMLCVWNNLGFVYDRLWDGQGSSEALDQSVHAYGQAANAVPPGHPVWSVVVGNYAGARYERFLSRSTIEDLQEALTLSRSVINYRLAARDSPLHGHYFLASYAGSVAANLPQSAHNEILDEAENLLLQNIPHSSLIHRELMRCRLGSIYWTRYMIYGRAKDLETAISVLQDSFAKSKNYHHREITAYSLSQALMALFATTGRLSDLEKVITVLQTAVGDDHFRSTRLRGVMHSLMGVALLRRFAVTGHEYDAYDAIQHLQQALQLFPQEHSEHFIGYYGLGLAEYQVFHLKRDMTSLNNSIAAYKRALSSMPLDHSDRAVYLSSLAKSQFIAASAEGQEDIEDGLETLFEAARHTPSLPKDRHSAAVEAARAAHTVGRLEVALCAYRLAVSLLPEVAWIGLEDELRMHRLARQPTDVSQDAAACAIELGLYEAALELLEGGRSILWNSAQELRADLAKLRDVVPEIAKELEQTNSALANKSFGLERNEAESSRAQERHRIHRLAGRRTQLLNQVREVPGLQHFLLPPTYRALKEAAANGPVIVLNSSMFRCDALLIRPDRPIELIALTDVHHDRIIKEVEVLQMALRQAKDKRGVKFLETTLLDLLRRLWDWIGRPVCEVLFGHSESSEASSSSSSSRTSDIPERTRVWWCPTGPMSFLPIHACGPHDGEHADLFDLVTSSYTPTLSALLRAQTSLSTSPPNSFQPLVVCQPHVPGHTPLPYVLQELGVVGEVLHRQGTYLVGKAGTVSQTTSLLPTHSWLHISTHGTQNSLRPLDSSIALYDGPLKLSTIAQARLPHAEFAFLSACHSARGTEQLPDESMHLAAGMMFAGYKSVVATSWGIADKDAPHVAREFYKYLTRYGNTPRVTETAEALHVAVQRLRDSGVPACRWVPFIHLGA